MRAIVCLLAFVVSYYHYFYHYVVVIITYLPGVSYVPLLCGCVTGLRLKQLLRAFLSAVLSLTGQLYVRQSTCQSYAVLVSRKTASPLLNVPNFTRRAVGK